MTTEFQARNFPGRARHSGARRSWPAEDCPPHPRRDQMRVVVEAVALTACSRRPAGDVSEVQMKYGNASRSEAATAGYRIARNVAQEVAGNRLTSRVYSPAKSTSRYGAMRSVSVSV